MTQWCLNCACLASVGKVGEVPTQFGLIRVTLNLWTASLSLSDSVGTWCHVLSVGGNGKCAKK